MKYTNLLSPLFFISATCLSHGAIIWNNVPTNSAYSSGSTVVLTSQSTVAAGVTLDFQADANGTFHTFGGDRQLIFKPTTNILAGSSITFCFDFSRQLGSAGGARSAAKFRMANGTSISVDTMMYGGDQTLQDYWGPTSGPTSNHQNGGILQFQDTFVRDPTSVTDGSLYYGQGPTSAIFQGFSDPNTATITGGDDSPINSYDGDETGTIIPIDGDNKTLYHIVGPQRNATDFNFSGWKYTVNANEDIAAGTEFLWTFEGADLGPALPVPEPSGLVLIGLGAVSLLTRRKRG